MSGERRRRRLRRTGRTPFDAAPEPTADEVAGADAADGDDRAIPANGDSSTPDASGGPAVLGGPDAAGVSRRSGSPAGRGPRPGPPPQHRPSPADLADLSGPFALTAGVQDPDPPAPPAVDHHHDNRFDDAAGERGLRGLVGGGSSQVNVVAAMRARDASRPTDDDLAAAEAELPIVRRGWVPREELPRTH